MGHSSDLLKLGKLIPALQSRGEIPGQDPRAWRYHAFKALMDACKAGCESCGPRLDGWLVLESRDRMPCERKSIQCPVGRRDYVRNCHKFLETLGFGGDQAMACFLRENADADGYVLGDPLTHFGFVLDECSGPAKTYAFEDFTKKRNLILAGSTGPGKTYSALAVMAHLKVELGIENQMFVKAEQLLDDYMTDKMRETFGQAMRTRFLVLDDLGTELPSPRNEKNLYSLIDARLSANLPTLATLNMSAVDFVKRYTDKRLQDRFKLYKFVETSLKSKRRAR